MAKKIMIVRHGEKPDKADSIHGVDPQGEHDKKDLAPKGWQRSGALIRFFNPVNGQFSHPALAKPNAVFAASPEGEAKSARSQYTVQSVADSVGVKINLKHDKGDEKELVKDALSKDGVVLIAWEHKAILDVHLRSAITGKIGSPVTIRHHRFLRDPICHIVLGCIQVQTKGHSGWQARPARRRYTIGSQAERIAKPKLDTGNSLRERGSAQARFASTDTRLQGFPPPVQPALPLQSTIGNRPVQRLVASARLQPKLMLGAPDDVYEKEADAIAEQVMKSQAMGAASGRGSNDDGDREAMPGRSVVGHNLARYLLLRTPIRTLQRTLGNHGLADVLRQTLPERAIPELRRKCACGNESEQECSECSKNRLAREREAASERDGSEATAIVGDVLKTPGQPLTESARRALEPRFGYDFSRVRAHDGSEAAESASAVKEAAYNVGNHIVFGKGRYAPGTNEGDRLLAHELTHTIQQTGGVWLGRDPARGEAAEGGLLQRDLDPQYQTSPSAATPVVTGAADDSGPVSMAPIQVAGEPHAFEMEGGCEGLHLHGKTDGTFDGGTGSVVNQKVTKGEGCNCDKGVQCFHVTGTLVTNYLVSVTITMPPVPSGLTACERAKVQAFLQNVLLPHERDHEARLKTYNGQTKNPVDVTGCGQDDVTSKVQAIQDAEEPARRAAAQARSDAIDPFVRAIDCSDCEKQSAAPGAGQVGGGDTEIAAMRLPFSGHLRARAFTSGVDIVFDAGRYAPDSAAGRRLIAHELARVIQQSQAGAPSIQRQPTDAPEAKPTLVKSRQALTEWIKDPTASGTLDPKAWADLHKVEEKFADIAKVTQVRKIFIGPAAVSDPENVNIVSDKDIHHYMPGLNFSEFIMGRGETFYVDAAGGPPIEKLNPSPTGPLPKIAIVLGKEVSSSKQMALTTVRHEMIHAEHLILTLKTVEKWQAAKTKDSFDDWLSEQNKKGKISTLEQELVTEEEKTNRPNTELLAYTEGFMTTFLLADPPPAKNDDPAFEQLFGMFMSGSEPWANANPETRSEALGRLQQYYCQVLDPARQKAFENWVGKPPEARPSSLSGWDWRPKRQMHAHFFDGLKKIVDGKCAGLGGAKPARPGKASAKSKSS